MIEHIKNYLVGIFVIMCIIQPYFFMKRIGADVANNYYLFVWMWGVIIELAIVAILYLPYKVGVIARDFYNEVLAEPPSTVKTETVNE